jgi:hypothetical protein
MVEIWASACLWIETDLGSPPILSVLIRTSQGCSLMLANCLVSHEPVEDSSGIPRQFRRVIRHTLGVFLRFSHRYYSHQVSDHGQVRDLYRMISDHLGTDRLYQELRGEIEDMSQYLDSDALRRQGDTMVRLTVVATIGLVGVTTTGFWVMNLFSVTNEPAPMRLLYFFLILIPTIAITLYAVLRSRRLSVLPRRWQTNASPRVRSSPHGPTSGEGSMERSRIIPMERKWGVQIKTLFKPRSSLIKCTLILVLHFPNTHHMRLVPDF